MSLYFLKIEKFVRWLAPKTYMANADDIYILQYYNLSQFYKIKLRRFAPGAYLGGEGWHKAKNFPFWLCHLVKKNKINGAKWPK